MIKWSQIAGVGRNRLVRSSYIWLLFVPIAAKALQTVENPLTLTGLSEQLHVSMELPFSWKIFYGAAVLFSIANLVFYARCPEIIRDFSNFRDFQNQGRGMEYIYEYVYRIDYEPFIELFDKLNNTIRREDGLSRVPTEQVAEFYWNIHRLEDIRRNWYCNFCALLFGIGLILILFVFIENFVYVVRVSF